MEIQQQIKLQEDLAEKLKNSSRLQDYLRVKKVIDEELKPKLQPSHVVEKWYQFNESNHYFIQDLVEELIEAKIPAEKVKILLLYRILNLFISDKGI